MSSLHAIKLGGAAQILWRTLAYNKAAAQRQRRRHKRCARLSLRLADSPFTPARLVSSNGSVCVYHSSQFVEPLDVLRERWKAHVRGLENAEKDRNAALLASQAAPDALPLSTNGERFDSATEECMLRIMSSRANASRYWATEAEAKWLYRAPFTDAHLSDPGNRVVSHANELCRPMALYNVAGTADPSRFTPLTCRRYDPVNYAGRFYRPAVAVRMKAFALQYNCLHERQWITQRRAMGLGLSILPHIPLLAFSLDMPLFLINIGATHRRSAPAPRVSPAIAADCIVTSEDVLEAPERHVRWLAFMSPGDLYALSQRSSFSSYTQYSDASALARSYKRCSRAEKLKCEERAEAINDEVERAYQTEAQLLRQEDSDLRSNTCGAAAHNE
ncbi:hypothetical protein CGC21_25305 [Leishmania donovani]|uniref:Trypanosoma Tc-38 (p38) protein domain-containing protein n=1 Tax=Leishmania donovani TaxID=5661 RepID=A0A504XUG9_LEIDO|nr:hypothetical protein CGC21_25305 [Leishmania donovani]